MSREGVVVVLVPALGRGLLEGGALPRLHAALPASRIAGLVPSFPCLPTTVEASALRGQKPSRHRVRLSGDDASPAHPTVGERLEALGGRSFVDAGVQPLSAAARADPPELTLIRHTGLLQAALGAGPSSAERLEAAAQFDEELAGLRSRLSAESTLVVVGAPGVRAAEKTIQLPEDLGPKVQDLESGLLRMKPLGDEEADEVQERLLHCRGIERVLRGEGLSSWGAALENERGECYALAQAGWSFDEQAASLGHPEISPDESGLLIAFGTAAGPAWPPELHDYRIAPSLARRFELSEDEYLDRAFTL